MLPCHGETTHVGSVETQDEVMYENKATWISVVPILGTGTFCKPVSSGVGTSSNFDDLHFHARRRWEHRLFQSCACLIQDLKDGNNVEHTNVVT